MLHIEAPDETGHEEIAKKIQVIEDLDSKVFLHF